MRARARAHTRTFTQHSSLPVLCSFLSTLSLMSHALSTAVHVASSTSTRSSQKKLQSVCDDETATENARKYAAGHTHADSHTQSRNMPNTTHPLSCVPSAIIERLQQISAKESEAWGLRYVLVHLRVPLCLFPQNVLLKSMCCRCDENGSKHCFQILSPHPT